MDNIITELKFIINKELYQNEVIDFEEFKMMNDKILKVKNNEYS